MDNLAEAKLFELPEIIDLSGQAVTMETNLEEEEERAFNSCGSGSGWFNGCSNGS